MSTNAHASSAPETPRPARLPHLDALRGVAVLFMIVLHTAESWLQRDLQAGLGWGVIRHVGGQAAPLFLMLAGVGASLGWSAGPARAGARRAALARGLQVVLAGYALRLAMWWVDSAGITRASGLTAGALLAGGYAVSWRGLDALGDGHAAEARRLLTAGSLGASGALLAFSAMEPAALRTLLRQDVLQAIGASLVLIALLEPLLRRHVAVAVALAAGVTLATPWLRELMPGSLPMGLAGYIAPWKAVPGGPVPGRFPLFPWFAHALLGAAIGSWWGAQARRGRAEQAVIESAVLGAALGLVLCEWWPSLVALLSREPWLVPTVRIGYRFGLGLVLAAACVALVRAPGRRHLLALGRASLVIYCVHLEPAFGLLAQPVRRSLGYPAWAALAALLILAMVGLAHRWVSRKRRGRGLVPPAPAAASPEAV